MAGGSIQWFKQSSISQKKQKKRDSACLCVSVFVYIGVHTASGKKRNQRQTSQTVTRLKRGKIEVSIKILYFSNNPYMVILFIISEFALG